MDLPYTYKGWQGKYSGQLKNEKPHGIGSFQVNGYGFYEGSFVNGEWHGYGRMIWYNGYFEGEWNKGLMSGDEKRFNTNGKIM